MLVLKGETIPRTANVLRAFSPVSYGRAETTVERENAKKGTQKRYEGFRLSERDGENGRKGTQEICDRKARSTGGQPSRMPHSTRTQQPARVETGVNWGIREKINKTPRKMPMDENAKHRYHSKLSPDDYKRNEYEDRYRLRGRVQVGRTS